MLFIVSSLTNSFVTYWSDQFCRAFAFVNNLGLLRRIFDGDDLRLNRKRATLNDEVLRHYIDVTDCEILIPDKRMKEKKPPLKKRTKLLRPTDTELAILEILNDLKTGTVRQILNQHNRMYEVQAGYTSILKIVQIMTEKGLVEKDSSRRPQVYKPHVSWKKTQEILLTDLINKAFGGSAKELVLGALSTKAVSDEELDEIEAFLDKIDKGE